jgi:hypothetical protein
MSYLRFFPGGSGAAVELLYFDVLESEEIGFEAEVTDHPIENGGVVTDHVRQRPGTISISALVSNTPVEGPRANYNPNASPPKYELVDAPSEARPGDDARETLETIQKAGDTVDLFLGEEDTGRLYDGLVLQSLGFPRDARTGTKLRFSATFRKVMFAESKVVAAPKTTEPRAVGVKDRGTQPTKPATDAEKGAGDPLARELGGEFVRGLFN